MNITIKELRKQKKLTQTETAYNIGISFVAYCNLESGRTRISESKYKTVMRMADLLGPEIYDIAREDAECNK